jgi:hypothetical protein
MPPATDVNIARPNAGTHTSREIGPDQHSIDGQHEHTVEPHLGGHDDAQREDRT